MEALCASAQQALAPCVAHTVIEMGRPYLFVQAYRCEWALRVHGPSLANTCFEADIPCARRDGQWAVDPSVPIYAKFVAHSAPGGAETRCMLVAAALHAGLAMARLGATVPAPDASETVFILDFIPSRYSWYASSGCIYYDYTYVAGMGDAAADAAADLRLAQWCMARTAAAHRARWVGMARAWRAAAARRRLLRARVWRRWLGRALRPPQAGGALYLLYKRRFEAHVI
jgi:hypothetical protein